MHFLVVSLSTLCATSTAIRPVLDENDQYIGYYRNNYGGALKFLRLAKYGYWVSQQKPYDYGLPAGIDPRPIVDGTKILSTGQMCHVEGEYWYHGFAPDECKEEYNELYDESFHIISKNVVISKVGNQYLLRFECHLRPSVRPDHKTWRDCKVETFRRAISGTQRIMCPEGSQPLDYFNRAVLGNAQDVYCNKRPEFAGGHLKSSPMKSIGMTVPENNHVISFEIDAARGKHNCHDFSAGDLGDSA